MDFDRLEGHVDKLEWQLFAVVCIDDMFGLFELVELYDRQLDEDVLFSRYMFSV